MQIKDSVALVTGANSGIGQAFVRELLKRGVGKIYAATRDPKSLAGLPGMDDTRVVPITLDVTDAAAIDAAASVAQDVTLLINNAGYAAFEGAIAAHDLTAARQEMEVNYFAPLALTRAFTPVLAGSQSSAVVNMLSMMALVSVPLAATYAASKAAFLSVTKSLRAELAAQQTAVIGVMAVQTETTLGAKLPPPRMKPEELVADVLDAVQAGASEEVYAGVQTRGTYHAFMADPKGFQAMMSTRLPQKRS